MTSVADVFALFLLVFPLMFSPGPSNILSAASASKHGMRRTVPFVIGMDIMVLVPALVIGLGLSGLFAHQSVLSAFQIAGVAFILFLAWRLWTDAPLVAHKRLEGNPGLVEGALVQFANMKGLVLLLVVYSQFVDTGADRVQGVIKISIALTLFSLMSHFAWAFGGDWLAKRTNTPSSIRLLNRVYAVLLVLTCVGLLISSPPQFGGS